MTLTARPGLAFLFVLLAVLALFLALSLSGTPAQAQDGSEDEPSELSYLTVVVTEDDSDPDNVFTTFTITWNDAEDCSASYNAYLDGVVGDPIHLGSAASEGEQIAASLTNVSAESMGFDAKLYCGTIGSGRLVDSLWIPEYSRSFNTVPISRAYLPKPGTYSTEPGLTVLTVSSGTLTPAFHSQTLNYTVPDVANADGRITLTTTTKADYYTVAFIPGSLYFYISSCSHGGQQTSLSYQDDTGNPLYPLTDADANTPGFQMDLDEGENVFVIHVWPNCENGHVYKLTVTRATNAPANTPATGAPIISGTAEVGETLTVDTSGIDDADGMSGAVFSYQWLANDAEITGATSNSYTLVDADFDQAVKVRVSFDDDRNFLETLTSEATATVVTPLTAEFQDAPDKHLGTGVFTFVIAFSEPISIGYVTLRDDSLDVTNGSATKAKRVNGQSDRWKITVEPDSDADVTVVLPITEDCAAQDAVCTRDGTKLSNRSELTVPGPAAANSPPTGAPSISGTAQVGETLTVDTSGIDDADGMSGAVFSYQWIADGVDIAGATSDTYTPVEADLDKAVKVRVIFNDDDNNEETLTSPATAAVAAETAVPDAPQSLNVSPDDTGTLDVSWEAPASDGGSAITGYKVQWKSGSEDYDGSAGSTRQAEITDPASRTHTITGLTDGVEYTVRVIAVNDVGDGPPSDEATATPRETTPPELATATVDGTTLTLTYDEALDENSEPSSDAFSVTVGGTGRAVDGVSVSGSSVTLTLGSAVASGATVTVSYTAPTDAAAPRIQDEAGNPAASFSDQDVENKTPPPANSPATGAPTISGTAQAGETLTASTSDIEDDDGLDNVGYSYQWLANGADIAGATSSSYTLVEADNGKTIQVNVSFRDDKNNPETLTSAATAAVEPRPNTPATGAPTISGMVRVGETLTASTSDIDDADGMSGAVFIYHWLANGADIAGATNNTYTLVDTDVGKTIKVRVIFTDNADNEETLTSEATAAVEPRPNSPATGAPSISGTVRVGETLTAETSAIADADGMSGAVFIYQWLADDADIAGATSDTYTPVADDVGKAIQVKVSFRDDRNHQESLTSAATAAVEAAADDSSIWSATLTVGSSGSFHGYWKDLMGSLAPDGFNIDGSDYTVTSLNRYGDLMFAFVLDQALPGDFTLQVGDTTLRSEEADVTTSSSSYSYQWQNKIPDLADGDIVEVSLTASD